MVEKPKKHCSLIARPAPEFIIDLYYAVCQTIEFCYLATTFSKVLLSS